MGVKTVATVGVVGVAAGLVARSLVRQKNESGNDGDRRHPDGWKAVTIFGDPAAFATNGYPEPLRRIADVLEIRLDPAPGDKGFEVHARVRRDQDITDTFGDDDPEQAVRAALRDSKQLFETGEILRATPRPHGHRPPSLFGAVVDTAEDNAKGEGVL